MSEIFEEMDDHVKGEEMQKSLIISVKDKETDVDNESHNVKKESEDKLMMMEEEEEDEEKGKLSSPNHDGFWQQVVYIIKC